MLTGTVKFFNAENGYGFIQPDGGGPDVFLHGSAINHHGLQGKMVSGQRVSFDLVKDRKGAGSRAINLAVAAA
jgi:CspA family cold shock protein